MTGPGDGGRYGRATATGHLVVLGRRPNVASAGADGELLLIDHVRRDVNEPEETGIELLLSEPEIVAWLEPREQTEDDDDEPRRAA
jgi:hypothetical protein